MGDITLLGFTRITQNEYVEALELDYKAINPQWNIAPDTPDGQFIGLVGATFGLLDQQQENTYNSFDPDRATGEALDSLCKISNIYRLKGAPSTAVCRFTGTQGTDIPEGFLVRNSVTLTDWETNPVVGGIYTIDATGEIDIPMSCTVDGPNSASADTLTLPVNALAGVTSVTNPLPATEGRLVETDSQLRIRRYLSVALPASNQVDAMYAALANLTDVLSVQVYENSDSGETITNPSGEDIEVGNSLTIYVEYSGSSQPVADAIYNKKNPGVKLINAGENFVDGTTGDVVIPGLEIPDVVSVAYNVTSVVTSNVSTIVFNRPKKVPVLIKIKINRQGYADPAELLGLIQDAILEYVAGEMFDGTEKVGFNASGFGIGQDVPAARLFTPVNHVIGKRTPQFIVKSLLVGKDIASASAAALDVVPINAHEIPTFSKADKGGIPQIYVEWEG